MTLIRTTAVVLKIVDHGESDKIVTFYTAAAGRFTGIAKGAKRSSKRFVNKLELFTCLEISYSRRRRNLLAQIVEAELIDPYINLRQDYDSYIAASLIAEHVLSWARENDVDESLFSVLLWALNNLNSGRQALDTVIFFLVKLLSIVGYQPHLTTCIACGGMENSAGPYVFNIGRGGAVCGRCRGDISPSTAPIPLSLSTMKLLCSAQEMGLDKLNRLQFSAGSRKEALCLLKKYCEHLLQREIQSWTALGRSG
jgi:DNA repair protein RecO (recombination protein O)